MHASDTGTEDTKSSCLQYITMSGNGPTWRVSNRSARTHYSLHPLGDFYDYRDVVLLQLHLEESSPALQTLNIQLSLSRYRRIYLPSPIVFAKSRPIQRSNEKGAHVWLRHRCVLHGAVENFKTTTSRSDVKRRQTPTRTPHQSTHLCLVKETFPN